MMRNVATASVVFGFLCVALASHVSAAETPPGNPAGDQGSSLIAPNNANPLSGPVVEGGRVKYFARPPIYRSPGQGLKGMPRLPAGRRYYNGLYYGNYNNRYYGPQYGYF